MIGIILFLARLSDCLEGPDIGNIRTLLNVLLDVDTQVLEGPDIGNIRILLNVLLV